MKKLISACVIALVVSACGSHKAELPIEQQFPGPWKESYDLSITMALAKAGATNCGAFYFRDHVELPRQALVYCTGDGQRWTAWTVSRSKVDPRNSTAVGPFAPEPSIPVPAL